MTSGSCSAWSMSSPAPDEPRPLILRKPRFDYGPPQHRGNPGRPVGPLGYPNANPHRDKSTGILLNMSPCPACVGELKKRGRHRRHKRCLGQTVGQTVVIVCDCECNRMHTSTVDWIRDHPMALDSPKNAAERHDFEDRP